jgi:hypothetical protein
MVQNMKRLLECDVNGCILGVLTWRQPIMILLSWSWVRISFTDISLDNKGILKKKISRVHEKNINDLEQFS